MFLASCDDGPVYGSAELKPENGLVLKLTGVLSGTGRWNAGGYSLVVAGFDDSDYAVITKSVPQSVDGAAVTVVMSGIGESVTSLELCVINRLRRRVVTFASVSTISGDDTVRLPVGRMDVSVYSALQAGVFDASCVQCHGGSNHAAAGLYLTGDRSRESLVDIPSTVVGDAVRVLPGNADESILYGVVSTDMTRGWSFDHSALLDVTSVEFIKNWINNGAE